MKETVLITGGTGLVGSKLVPLLIKDGYDVRLLSTSKKSASNSPTQIFHWNPLSGLMEDGALDNVQHIIHLAGAGIADSRWTSKRKNLLQESRVRSADLLYSSLPDKSQLKTFISASGINYYGTVSTSRIFKEDDPPGSDFLGQLCFAWEEAGNNFERSGVRTVYFRTGVVLSNDGGALTKISFPFKFFAGAVLGSGKQYVPWVHIDDVIQAYLFALKNPNISGAYNLAVGDETTNSSMTHTIGKILRRPVLLPRIPAWALRIMLGEMSEILLKGSRVSSEKLQGSGFVFRYNELAPALREALNRATS